MIGQKGAVRLSFLSTHEAEEAMSHKEGDRGYRA